MNMSLLSPAILSHPFITIILFHVQAIIPHAQAVRIILSSKDLSGPVEKRFDNRNPRGAAQSAVCSKLSPEDLAKYEKAEAAHANGLENFPLFAASVISATVASYLAPAGLQLGTVKYLAWGGILLRSAYNFAYLRLTVTRRGASMRSLLWAAHVALCYSLLGQAAIAFAQSY
jgi:uncharacterized MAPEG superfamily protein